MKGYIARMIVEAIEFWYTPSSHYLDLMTIAIDWYDDSID